VTCVQTKEYKAKHTLPTIRRNPDELWDEFKKVLSREKPPKTVGRPIIPYRKLLDGILYVLRTGCPRKMLPKEYGPGSVGHRRFQD
jgi:putative transposase